MADETTARAGDPAGSEPGWPDEVADLPLCECSPGCEGHWSEYRVGADDDR